MKKFKKVYKIGEDGDEKHFIFIHLFIIRLYLGQTAFSSIMRIGINLTHNPTLTLKCVAGASRLRMQAKSLGPHTVDSSGIWIS